MEDSPSIAILSLRAQGHRRATAISRLLPEFLFTGRVCASPARGRRRVEVIVEGPFNVHYPITRVWLACLVLTLLIPAIPPAIGETNSPLSKSGYELTGRVSFFHVFPVGAVEDGSGVVVWLVPAQGGPMARLNAELHYRMIQRHKMFEPHLLVVPTGSIVEFPNLDPWLHNVFSRSASKRFDLG